MANTAINSQYYHCVSNQFGILFENCEYMAFNKEDVELALELNEVYSNIRYYKNETQIIRVNK